MSEAIFSKISILLDTPEPAELGPGPRKGVWLEAVLDREIDKVLGSTLRPERQQLIRALLLLWHDHFEPAHSIAQEIANQDGSFVHGILHRREPDYGNAAYWFRRVGEHPVFSELAERSRALLQKRSQGQLADELILAGQWNAFGFIDTCERANRRGVSEEHKNLLREIQEIETRSLLEWFCNKSQG
jgi:hypothetical protein